MYYYLDVKFVHFIEEILNAILRLLIMEQQKLYIYKIIQCLIAYLTSFYQFLLLAVTNAETYCSLNRSTDFRYLVPFALSIVCR